MGPKLKRAAPEIYLSCLSEGSQSIRHWVETNFSSMRGSEIWIELWDRASQIDFGAAAHGANDQELLAWLASNDLVEVHLRRLASVKYRVRTGDKTGASQMLAIKAPGAASDVAPTWLVNEVTAHSKAEFQRAERVRKGGGKGDPKGKPDKDKGKDPKGKGKGKDGAAGGAAAQA